MEKEKQLEKKYANNPTTDNYGELSYFRGKKDARKELIEEIMNLIDNERDNGNIAPHEFSPAICLSNLMKLLEEKK